MNKQYNWANNISFGAAVLHTPQTVPEVQSLVANAAKLKTLGSRHSFNTVADTTGELI
jgi:xylitol oxidase